MSKQSGTYGGTNTLPEQAHSKNTLKAKNMASGWHNFSNISTTIQSPLKPEL